MKHLRPVSVQRVDIPDKAASDAGQIFIQIWAYVMGTILLLGLGIK